EEEAQSLARHAVDGEPRGFKRAEGNPLFIIELARASSISAMLDVPMTLSGIIGARLDELPAIDRELLQRAAVVGETFTADDAALLSGRAASEAADTLDRLARLLYLNPAPDGMRFHHALVRDVAYGRLSAAERLKLHAHYARNAVSSDNVEALAHHLWEAVGSADSGWVWEGSEELAQLRTQAREANLESARRNAARFAHERALEACRKALSLAVASSDVAKVEQAFGDVCVASGESDESWVHYLRARDA